MGVYASVSVQSTMLVSEQLAHLAHSKSKTTLQIHRDWYALHVHNERKCLCMWDCTYSYTRI